MNHFINGMPAQNRAEVWSLVFSNLALSSQKQHRSGMAKLFNTLSDSFEDRAKKQYRDEIGVLDTAGALASLQETVKEDLDDFYPKGFDVATNSRGTLRALTWGKKVTSIQKSLLKRYARSGAELLKEGENVYVCDACGFIMIKDKAPEICPVCKAPAHRFISF